MTARCSPPWPCRSACRSPSRFSRRTTTLPATGLFHIAVRTIRPCHSTSRGSPTLTDTSFNSCRFEWLRAYRHDLRDVIARFCPMEMRGVPGKDDDAAGRIRFHLVAIEFLSHADIKDAGHHRIDAVFAVPVRHDLSAGRHIHPDRVRLCLRGILHQHGEPCARWKRRVLSPDDFLGQDRLEYKFVAAHVGFADHTIPTFA